MREEVGSWALAEKHRLLSANPRCLMRGSKALGRHTKPSGRFLQSIISTMTRHVLVAAAYLTTTLRLAQTTVSSSCEDKFQKMSLPPYCVNEVLR